MSVVPKTDTKENRFKKILDDAGRTLEDIGGYRFPEGVPKELTTTSPVFRSLTALNRTTKLAGSEIYAC